MIRIRQNHRRSSTTTIAVLLAALVLVGCSPTAETTDTSPSSTAPQQVLDAVKAGYESTSVPPPAVGPKPTAGKNIWILSATQQVYGLAQLSTEVGRAAKTLGWTSNVCDGQNNVGGGWANCVRQAVAARADAIVLESIDCGAVKAPLQEARNAGVAIASLTSFDCDDPTQGSSEALFDASIEFLKDTSTPNAFFEAMGKLRADWIIAETGGNAKVLQVTFDGVAFGSYLAKGFNDEIATCENCKIVSTLALTPNDIPNIRQKFETALLQAKDVNAVSVDVDFMFTAGIQQALISAARPGLVVAGGECGRDNLEYIRSGGGQQMCVGNSIGHIAYAGMDQLNRHFAGEKPVVQGVGWQLVDVEHNLPASAGVDFEGPVDYRSGYESTWTGQ